MQHIGCLRGSPKRDRAMKVLIEERNNGRGTTMETYTTVKGQIVIPSSVRKKLGIKEGTRIQIELDEQARLIILKPITREYIHSRRGKYKGKGLLKALIAEKKREREL